MKKVRVTRTNKFVVEFNNVEKIEVLSGSQLIKRGYIEVLKSRNYYVLTFTSGYQTIYDTKHTKIEEI